jgi:hypothetical protein
MILKVCVQHRVRPAADFHIAEYRDVRKRFVDAGEVTPFDHHAVEHGENRTVFIARFYDKAGGELVARMA